MTIEISTRRPATRAPSSALWGARCDARGSVPKLDQGGDH